MAEGKEQQFSTHFEHLTVKVLHVAGGLDVFDVSAFVLDKPYRVLATYFRARARDDGSSTPVFLMEGPGGAIVEKACKRFAVVEMS